MHDSTDADETRRIDLPESLAERLERRMVDTEFDSVDGYAAVALDRLLTEMEAMEETTAAQESTTAAQESTTAAGETTVERDPDADDRAVGDGSPDEDGTTQPSGPIEERLDSLGYL
jgi:hypothetical protein